MKQHIETIIPKRVALDHFVPLLNRTVNRIDDVIIKPNLLTKIKKNTRPPQQTYRLILLARVLGRILSNVIPSSLSDCMNAITDNINIKPLAQRGIKPGPGAYLLLHKLSLIA